MGVTLAWLFGEGLITWRWIKNGSPPTPGALIMSSGFFALCALLGEYPPARSTATLIAVGIDIAALLQVLGKDPGQATGWPPPVMPDATTSILPSGIIASSGKPAIAAPGVAAPGGKKWNLWTGYL
jgi:hypothetical protein